MNHASIESPIATSLARIHRAITRGLDVATEYGPARLAAAPEDGRLREGLCDYVRALAFVLHEHHEAEDHMVFPSLRDALAGVPWDRLMAEHRTMAAYLERVQEALPCDGDEAGPRWPLAPLVNALEPLRETWLRHIAVEEAGLSSEALNAAFSPAEQERLAAGWQEAPPSQTEIDAMSLVLPWLLHNLAPDDRAAMIAEMPPEAVAPVDGAWAERWAPMRPLLLP
jgi:hemerythrin-like domain-containing protein